MVSEAEYDKNQAAFKTAQATTTTQSGTSIPTTGQNLPFGQFPDIPGTLDAPQGSPERSRQLAAMAMSSSPVGAVGAAGGIGKTVLSGLKGRSIGVMLAPIVAFFAGASGITNSIVGKEWNKFSSDNNLSTGNLKLAAFEKMYTEPIEVGGKWAFLFSDAAQLDERMPEAGVDRSLIPGRIQQLNQLRQANVELIASAGEPVDFESQQIPGETALQTAQRIATEKNKAIQSANTVVNAQGMTQAQVDAVNQQFQSGQVQGEITKQKQQSNQQKPPTAAELAQLPPGQLTPDQMEKIIKAKTPNVEPTTSAAAPAKTAEPNQGMNFTPAGGFTPRWRTKDEAQNAMGMSLTDEAWRKYLRTGSFS